MSVGARRGSFLLLLRGGGLWAISNTVVRGIHGSSGEYRIRLAEDASSAELVADQVLGVVADLTVWPATVVLRRYWPQTTRGIAIHGGAPLVVIDPCRPPQELMLQQGEVSDADGS